MAYSVKADFQKRVSDKILFALTDPANLAIVDANLNEAVATADSIIDSYLSMVTEELPLTAPPAFIKEYSIVIALKQMQKRRANVDIPEWAQKEYDDAINHLKAISQNRANINLASTVTKIEDVVFEDAPVIFTRGDF